MAPWSEFRRGERPYVTERRARVRDRTPHHRSPALVDHMMLSLKSLIRAGALVGLALMLPSQAFAGSAAVSSTSVFGSPTPVLTFTAAPGERNDIALARDNSDALD